MRELGKPLLIQSIMMYQKKAFLLLDQSSAKANTKTIGTPVRKIDEVAISAKKKPLVY